MLFPHQLGGRRMFLVLFDTFCTFILLLLFFIFYICTFIPCFYYLELFGTFCTCILLLLFWISLLLFPQQVGDQLLSFPRSHVSWLDFSLDFLTFPLQSIVSISKIPYKLSKLTGGCALHFCRLLLDHQECHAAFVRVSCTLSFLPDLIF